MQCVKIKGSDVFNFKAMVSSFADDGKSHLTVNYKKETDKMSITLEAFSDKDTMKANDTITYREFSRRYPKHRVYINGYVTRG